MRSASLLGIALAAVALAAACSGGESEDRQSASVAARPQAMNIAQASAAQLAAAGLDIPLAPQADRVDLAAAPFSNPTKVTNPLFPISRLPSAILSGRVDGKPFKTETTLLPETRIIEWPEGRQIEALVSQYVAYLNGRIEEVALDFYAQADDGSVWYLGEDVFNYRDGVIVDTDGTWLAGKEGPGALIMPADPQVGDVYRPENIPGLVFEEVRIKAIGKTVRGPSGPVTGALVASELHQNGSREDKVFAPGYGEFLTDSGGDVEAMTLAVPADKLAGPPPAQLETLSTGADAVFDGVGARDWQRASAAVRTMTRAWERFQAGDVPPRLEARMGRALKGLVGAVAARDRARARHAAIDVSQSGLDLRLRHRPPAEIDRARFELWARQLQVDAEAGDAAGVSGDLATLEWIRDRFVHTLAKVDVTRIDAHLVRLRGNLGDENLDATSETAAALREAVHRAGGV